MDWGLIKALGPKAAVVYNPADPWFQHYHEMHEALPGLEVRHTLLHLSATLSKHSLLMLLTNAATSQLPVYVAPTNVFLAAPAQPAGWTRALCVHRICCHSGTYGCLFFRQHVYTNTLSASYTASRCDLNMMVLTHTLQSQ